MGIIGKDVYLKGAPIARRYGIEAYQTDGKRLNLTDRNLMVLDVIHLNYGMAGQKTLTTNVSGVVLSTPSGFEFAPERLRPEIRINGKTISWKWVSCGGVYAEGVTMVVLG
ncbi:hypothetical protein [Avibacterium sp. 21-599]|uniref:hypothetical protein n=1 Tax=Avibacterium sp. 21-599 TaxID=2911528 RepID=UPI002247DC42|nr:hypothetical protein [Avibacterium sp. 21-599]MCW9717322.1 hypothetical protein [Avibacterium sp. 21-599]